MGSGGGGDTTTTTSGTSTVRYAPYIEAHHEEFLDQTAVYVMDGIGAEPYSDVKNSDGEWLDINIEVGFFGTGYALANFPSQWDIYGKFMAGMDIDSLWTQEYESTVNSPVIDSMIEAEVTIANDTFDQTILPKFQIGMRDMNAVMTSSYVIGKALLVDSLQKELVHFGAELRYKMVPVAQDKWKTHLIWNQNVVSNYLNLIKTYLAAKSEFTSINYGLRVKNAVWNLTVLDFEKANLGALQGAITSGNDSKSTTGKDGGNNTLGTIISLVGMAAMVASMF
jgi:hypothetical protein